MKKSIETTEKPKTRCAIYTRKSNEEGLEQEYNSLDAQKDAARDYISSQQHEGWVLVDNDYDDGGFSGGNIKRPALQRLLDDIKEGKVDCIVCYKIDRLSRSIADFIRMVEVFDEYDVSFVSVTQSFDTKSAMGRLTLNILLSFAAFEREITGERIRDKVAASKKKGMWMGGVPPLGYDVIDRKLIINPKEAKLVKHIFKRFTETGSATLLVKELKKEGHRNKPRTNCYGKRVTTQFIKNGLYRVLNNRVYLGEIKHKDKHYEGEHKVIITQAVWDLVQDIFSKNSHTRGNQTRANTPAMLRGLLFDDVISQTPVV
jgi:site-specific DNA recombinase